MKEYGLCRLPRTRGVSTIDDIYHILFYHWALCNLVFPYEEQRNQVPAGILIAAYFGLRPVSVFDTRLKLRDGEENTLADNKTLDYKNYIDPNGNQEIGSSNKASDSNNDGDNDTPTLVDFDDSFSSGRSTDCDSESDNDTDDGIHDGSDDTRTMLWRHITFLTAPDPTLGLLNVVIALVTIVHTKGEDNRPVE